MTKIGLICIKLQILVIFRLIGPIKLCGYNSRDFFRVPVLVVFLWSPLKQVERLSCLFDKVYS